MKNILQKLFGHSKPTPSASGQERPSFSLTDMVQPRYERAPEAVPGPFYVCSDQCIICSLPPDTAPSNIRYHFTPACGECPHYCYVHKQPETHVELDLMIEALAGSCVAAIRYCGTDPYILQRLRDAGQTDQCDALK